MSMKKCNTCEKSLIARNKSGYCTKCWKKTPDGIAYRKRWESENKEHLKNYLEKWSSDNKDVILEHKKKYRETHKVEIQEYRKQTKTRLYVGLRGRLNRAIRRKSKVGSAVRDLGCTIEFFMKYIESLFKPGMSWDNWSRTGWHIDHIIPLSAFNLEDKTELVKAVHYTNLQPLWAKENLSKGGVRNRSQE